MRIECLLAHEDGTWTTDLFDVPERFNSPEVSGSEIELWLVTEGPCSGVEFRKIVKIAVLDISPELPEG